MIRKPSATAGRPSGSNARPAPPPPLGTRPAGRKDRDEAAGASVPPARRPGAPRAAAATAPPVARDVLGKSAASPAAKASPDVPLVRAAKPPSPARPPTRPAPRQAFNPSKRRGPAGPKVEPKILWQSYFKSVGPRTYAAQLKECGNGNHLLVLTEGKRDEATDEVRKCKVFVYAEDFVAFFRMLQESVKAIKDNPLSDETRRRRQKYWAKKNGPATPRK